MQAAAVAAAAAAAAAAATTRQTWEHHTWEERSAKCYFQPTSCVNHLQSLWRLPFDVRLLKELMTQQCGEPCGASVGEVGQDIKKSVGKTIQAENALSIVSTQ